MLEQLAGLPAVSSSGGWSLLLDVRAMGYESSVASGLLLEKGKIAATPMKNWGKRNGDGFVRFVYSNEPIQRLMSIGDRVKRALLD
jgi:aspartate/methionine/tyrosine aminotransferase